MQFLFCYGQFFLRYYNTLPKKELHLSLWVIIEDLGPNIMTRYVTLWVTPARKQNMLRTGYEPWF